MQKDIEKNQWGKPKTIGKDIIGNNISSGGLKNYRLINEYVSGINKICQYKNNSGSGLTNTLRNKFAHCPLWSGNNFFGNTYVTPTHHFLNS